ncbi:MAG: BadF/BadG/BcrA/BcrD ATPase family protein [Armatimonadota bacterium]|nr:BadF/BadG/BcrA/BcrD ATPase family protein [Armatimonadota bacterium]
MTWRPVSKIERAVLGFDGGHTGCRAVVATLDGTVTALASGGAVSPVTTYLQRRRAVAAARSAIKGALAQAGPARVVGACLGLTTGGDNSPMAPTYRDLLSDLLPRVPVRLEMDAVTNMIAAGCGERGVVVIAGGGAIAYTVTKAGRIVRAGGWGSALGDEGSAYAIGRAAIAAMARHEDGRGPSTRLTAKLLTYFGVKDPHDIRRLGSTGRLDVAQIARLAPIVAEVAAEGDQVARRIVREAALDLAELAAAVLRRSGRANRPTLVFLTGGVFNDHRILRPAFVRQLRRQVPAAVIRAARFPPVLGAVLLALRDAGVIWVEPLFERLESSWLRMVRA